MRPKMIGKNKVHPVGIGTMPWANSKMWGYGALMGVKEAGPAYDAAVAAGVDLFDTAEIYGFGKSEKIVGEILAARGSAGIKIATKYAPLPWRRSIKSFKKALEKSLTRLGLDSITLYQTHFSGGGVSVEELMSGMADALDEGKIEAAGVSNYSAEEMRRAHEVLVSRGHRLASNQVEFSLVHRSPEADGVLETCRELGVTLIAYSPLGRGLLSGKYRPGSEPKDMRKRISHFKGENFGRIRPLLDALEQIAAKYKVTMAQAAINWLARIPEVFPIPGAKNEAQSIANAEAASFDMTDEDAGKLDELSAEFKVAKPFRRDGSRS
jgi:aryl-alcohol dehydrogenase-like predicted oxidoreductase